MGSVALGVVDYIQKKLNAEKFAEIKVDPLSVLDSVIVDDGIAKLPQPPHNSFYYVKNPELIIFVGEAQLPGQSGVALLEKVLDAAIQYKVSMILTGAAFPLPVSYRDIPEIFGAVNRKPLTEMLRRYGIKLMEGGHISGLNGLILGLAEKRKLDAICLLSTMPQYAISLPNPKASAAIVEKMSRMLDLSIDMGEFEEFIKDMDEKMSVIEDKVKDVLTIEKEEPESPPHDKKIPGYIMEKIEKLFREARANKGKAISLKKELDRWDLYKLYEDRFLDLFKDKQ